MYLSLRSQYGTHVAPCSVGIIASYRSQRKLLASIFRERLGSHHDVEISTIDGFQGREKDIVIFSCVRAPAQNPHQTSSFQKNLIVEAQFGGIAVPAQGDAAEADSADSAGSGIGFLREWQVFKTLLELALL